MNSFRLAIVFMLILTSLVAAFPALADYTCDAAVDYDDLGVTQYNAGQLNDAVTSFTCAVERDPESATAFNWRGNTYRNLGNYDAALADYTQAITIDEDYALAYNNRGWVYYTVGDWDAALADYDKALELDPGMAFAYNNRGLIFQQRGEQVQAIADFRQAINLELEPDWADYNLSLINADGLLLNARLAYDNRDFAQAVEDFTAVIARDPNNATAYYLRGRSYTVLDEPQRALEDFNRLVELRPNAYAFWERAVARAEIGAFIAARADAAHAATLESDHVNNFITQGTIAALSDQYAEAGEQFYSLMQRWEVERVEHEEVVNTVEMTPGTVHVIPFEAEAGQTVTVIANSTEADPVIVILDPAGNPINGDDDSGVGLGSHICLFSLPETGTYTLLISHAGGGSEGTIDLTLSMENTAG
ncbi:MAG: hypothetical protein OHK0046_22790 [Anaerolineae bacterium]